MKRKKNLLAGILVLTMVGLITTSCASILIEGGKPVRKGKTPANVLVKYRAEGTVPDNIEYELVRTDKGDAIFEKSPDGSGTLFFNHWSDEAGDHFSVIVINAYEFIVPADRSLPAEKYVYPDGTFTYKFRNGVKTPVPNNNDVEPVAILIPVK